MSMPKQKPGRSRQDYRTPEVFLRAVRRKLGIHDFVCDLAASAENAVCEMYFDQELNALAQPWTNLLDGPGPQWNWLNPPFKDIAPWAQKAYEEMQCGANTAMLIPISIADWWETWVHGKVQVLLVKGRLSFDGIAPYPKDVALLLYGEPDRYPPAYDLWDWREDARLAARDLGDFVDGRAGDAPRLE